MVLKTVIIYGNAISSTSVPNASEYQSIVQTFPYLILTLIWLIIENGTGIPSRTAVKWLGMLHVSSNFGYDVWLYLILLTVIYKVYKYINAGQEEMSTL